MSKTQRRILTGALLAGAFFLVVAGISEIVIANDLDCRALNDRQRLPPDPFDVCLDELQWYFTHAAARGGVWAFNRNAPAFSGWLVNALLSMILGGLSTQLSKNLGHWIFLGLFLGPAEELGLSEAIEGVALGGSAPV